MKLFFLISTLILTLTSCSKNEKNHLKVSDTTLPEIVFEPLSIRTSLVDGINALPSASLDFATLQPKQSGTQELIITNGLSGELVFGASDIDSNDIAPFTMTESCSNKTIARNRSCKLTFNISNNPNSVETVLTKSLTIKGSIIQLTATLAADSTPINSPVSGIIVSPNSLDFGLMKSGENKELSIAVTNKGTSTQIIPAPIISNPKISVTSNTCSSLVRNRSCSIKIRYSASDDESVTQQSFTSIANNEITHSILVQSPTINQPQILTISPVISSSNLNLNEPQIQSATLSFTNTGTLELPSPVQVIAQPSTGIVINSISCSGGLSRGRICSVSYSLNSALISGGASQIQFKLQSGTLASSNHVVNLNVTKLSSPCSLSDVQANGWNTSNQASISGMKIGSDVSQCVVSNCNLNFLLNNELKNCSPIACTLINATDNSTIVSEQTIIPLKDFYDTYIDDVTGHQVLVFYYHNESLEGPLLETTSYKMIQSEYDSIQLGNTVQSTTGTNVIISKEADIDQGNGVFRLKVPYSGLGSFSSPASIKRIAYSGLSSISNVSSVTGNVPNCSIGACSPSYKLSLDNKLCVVKNCNELNTSELSTLGFNITGATISGVYPSCTISCNSSLQELASDGKSCVDKPVIFSRDFSNPSSIVAGEEIVTPTYVSIDSGLLKFNLNVGVDAEPQYRTTIQLLPNTRYKVKLTIGPRTNTMSLLLAIGFSFTREYFVLGSDIGGLLVGGNLEWVVTTNSNASQLFAIKAATVGDSYNQGGFLHISNILIEPF
jgi:hypothetical protein